MSDTFEINRGSDLEFTLNWPDGAGGNADLTGYTVDLFDVSANAVSFLTATLTTAATGLITVNFQWDDSIENGKTIYFRVRIVLGTLDQTTNKLWIYTA